MPITIADNLPAKTALERENIFIMPEGRAIAQDIRPLRLLILNLMPTKIVTETQLLRLLSNTPLQLEIDLLQTSSYQSKNTAPEHLLSFYKTFDDVRMNRYDGMIITGAPVEQMPFEQVDYWKELSMIMYWSVTHVYSTLYICWGAQAALYYFYGIDKQPLPEKCFGIFEHKVLIPTHPLLRGFDDRFFAPHSRHTEISLEALSCCNAIDILATSKEAGLYIAASKDGRQFFVTGHSEYDRDTLAKEYFRDKDKGQSIQVPRHYFPGDDPAQTPIQNWRSHANLLYVNWLNYYVYQETPFDLKHL